MRREIASWKADGWSPTGSDVEELLAAYEASRAGAPPSDVEELLAPLREELGADVVAEAFRLIHAQMEAWRAESAEATRIERR